MTAISIICESIDFIMIIKDKPRMESRLLIQGVKSVYPQEKPADGNGNPEKSEKSNGTAYDKSNESQSGKGNEASKRSLDLDSSSPNKSKKICATIAEQEKTNSKENDSK